MRTAAADLPVRPPVKINDALRTRIDEAERVAFKRARPKRIGRDEAAELAAAAAVAAGGEEPRVELVDAPFSLRWHRAENAVEVGEGKLYRPDVLHAAAHCGVDGIFPAHGVEYARAYLGLIGRFEPKASTYERAFREAKVHTDVGERIKLVRRRAVTIANAEEGALIRLILDEPAEEEIVQLLAVSDRGLEVHDEAGDRTIAMERLRYISCRYTATNGART